MNITLAALVGVTGGLAINLFTIKYEADRDDVALILAIIGFVMACTAMHFGSGAAELLVAAFSFAGTLGIVAELTAHKRQ